MRNVSRATSLGPDEEDNDFTPVIPSAPLPRIQPNRQNSVANMAAGVVARATVDTTLAVIPAEAFRRLTKKYPKATGHIVQGW